MDSNSIDERIARREATLATCVRQYMRAAEAGDVAAAEMEKRSVCITLSQLLHAHLERGTGWDTVERWIDNLACDRWDATPPDRVAVRGRVLWAQAQAGGPFWEEPFAAEVRIDWETSGVRSYHLRFSDDRPVDQKRYRRAAPPDDAAPDRWAFQFRKGA